MSAQTRVLVVLTAAWVAVSAAGCDSGDVPGVPENSATSNFPGAGGSGDGVQAPRVAEPLDASAFIADPCRSLTDEQRRDFRFEEGREVDMGSLDSTTCDYANRDTQISLGITYEPELPSGLSQLYRKHADGDYPVWEEMVIDGYPAVRTDSSDPATDAELNTCRVAVALNDAQFFSSTVTDPVGEGDTCQAAKNAASEVLATIKAGA